MIKGLFDYLDYVFFINPENPLIKKIKVQTGKKIIRLPWDIVRTLPTGQAGMIKGIIRLPWLCSFAADC
jgi:hypothetical protein